MRKQANTHRVLVVDDDKSIATLIVELLAKEGLDADIALCGNDAIQAAQESYDLIILDIMMPGMDGFETCKCIRAFSKVPIIFLSAKDDVVDKVTGLTVGADDYIAKPFTPHELIARVKAHIRRTSWSEEDETDHNELLVARGLELNVTTHECHLHGIALNATPKEFELLHYLMRHPNTPHSTQELFEAMWHEPFDESGGNSIMTHIRRLRKKIAKITDENYIVTVWGVGYKIQS